MNEQNAKIIELFTYNGRHFFLVDDRQLVKTDPEWKTIWGSWGKDYIPLKEVWISHRIYRIYRSHPEITLQDCLDKMLQVAVHEIIEIEITGQFVNESKKTNHEPSLAFIKGAITLAHQVAVTLEKNFTFIQREEVKGRLKQALSNLKS